MRHNLLPALILLASCIDFSGSYEDLETASAELNGNSAIIGPGAITEFASSNSSLNYKNVDETDCNGNVDYNVVRKGVGAVDTYEVDISSVPVGAIIWEIRITPCASRDEVLGSTGPTFEAFSRWNGDERRVSKPWTLPQQSSPVPVPLQSWDLPASLIKEPTSKLEVGVRVLSNPQNQGMRLSQLAITLIYAEPSEYSGGFGPGEQSNCEDDHVCEPAEGCGCQDCEWSCSH